MKHFLSLLLCLSAFSLHVWAQKPLVIPLNPQDTSAKAPTLTVYFPQNPNGMAIIACPGGGYAYLASRHEGHDMAAWMNTQGILYAVLAYRMPNGDHTIPLSDAQAAITQVRTHASEWHLDPNLIGIMGSSAGGHLASTLATHYASATTRPDFQILLYPVITMHPGITHAGSRENLLGPNPTQELEQLFSNETQVNANTPPAFLMLSSDDNVVPPANSIDYFTALQQHGVPVTMHIYPYGGHGWGFGDSFGYKRSWTADLEKWLREMRAIRP